MSTKNSQEEEDRNHLVPLYIETATTTSALAKLSKQNFKNKKIILIKIKIADKLDENLNQTSFPHCFDTSSAVLITFCSENEIKIFWKSPICEKFHFLCFCDDVGNVTSNYCEQFLTNEIKDSKNGK